MDLFVRGPGQTEPDPDPLGTAVRVMVDWIGEEPDGGTIRPEDLWEQLYGSGFLFKVTGVDGRNEFETAPDVVRKSGVRTALDVLDRAHSEGLIGGDSRTRRYWRLA